jgi:hypothetical protein
MLSPLTRLSVQSRFLCKVYPFAQVGYFSHRFYPNQNTFPEHFFDNREVPSMDNKNLPQLAADCRLMSARHPDAAVRLKAD